MGPARRRRRTLSVWTVVAVLFMQLAGAAYACSTTSGATTVDQTVTGPDCDAASPIAMDPDLPLLCKAHCAPDGQAVGGAGAGQAASPPSLLWAVLDWSAATEAVDAPERVTRWLRAGAAPPGSPPRYLTLLALRN